MTRRLSAVVLLSAVLMAQATAQGANPADTNVLTPTQAAPMPTVVTSLSTIRLSFALQATHPHATYLIAQRPIGASRYVAGSTRLNGVALPDPLVGAGGTLYWTLTPSDLADIAKGPTELSFRMAHTAPLPPLPQPGLLRHQSESVQDWQRLSGQVDLMDYAGATPLTVPATENPGAIKLPLDGGQIRRTDQIGVVVEVPVGSPLSPTINGQPIPASQLGETVGSDDGLTERRHYYAVKIRPGINTIGLGDEQISVQYAGATARYQVEALSLVADGSTPIRVQIRALDANGILSEQPYLTLQSNLAPTQPDARPGEIGYQLALKDGVGLLELQPQNTPVTLRLDLLRDNQLTRHTFEVQAGGKALGVGMLSATLGLNGDNWAQQVGVQARAYYEGPLGAGKVYVSADKNGLTPSDEVNQRNTTFGDGSQQSVPLLGQDPLAFAYEHPNFRVSYRQSDLPINVVPLSGQMTALSASTKGKVRVSGFAALLPSDLIRNQTVTPTGTRLLRLGHEYIAPDSESLTLVTRERDTGTELERRTLTRNLDYTLDPQTGIVTLAGALSAVDGQLNTLTVLATYRLQNSSQNRTLAYGAQIETGTDNARLGAALVQLDGVTTYGVAGHYATPNVQADGRVLFSSGVHAEATAAAQWGKSAANLSAYYQDLTYQGLGGQGEGTRVKASVKTNVTERLATEINASYLQTVSSQQGEVSGLALYRVSPLTLGVGAKYAFGDQQGLSLTGSLGYDNGKLAALLTHNQPVSGDVAPVTDFKISYPISRHLKIGFTDHYVWNDTHTAALTLESTVGRTNYAAAYELPNAKGSGHRARVGVTTSLPLNERTTLGLRGAYLRDLQANTGQVSASADLTYRAPSYVAMLGTDLSYDTALTTVLRAGVSGDLSPRLNLSADSTLQFGPKSGGKVSLGYAYRTAGFSSLGYLRYQSGSLAGSHPSVAAGVSAEYRQPRLSVRGGLDARRQLQDPDSLTYQPQLGISANLTQRVRLGAWGRALIQPATATTALGYGVEAGIQTLPGAWITAGYNPRGFGGLDTAGLYTKEGAYLRLDLTLDETLNGAKK